MEFFGSIKNINGDVFMLDTSDFEFLFPTNKDKKLKVGDKVFIEASKEKDIFGDYYYLVRTCKRETNVKKS